MTPNSAKTPSPGAIPSSSPWIVWAPLPEPIFVIKLIFDMLIVMPPTTMIPMIEAYSITLSIIPDFFSLSITFEPRPYPKKVMTYLIIKCGTSKIIKKSKGPNIFPCIAKEVPTPVASILNVPQKKASPTPDKGPIIASFTAEIDCVSKSGSLAFCSSIAVAMPSGKVIIYGVTL